MFQGSNHWNQQQLCFWLEGPILNRKYYSVWPAGWRSWDRTSPSSIPYLQFLFIWSFLQTGYGSGRPLTWVFELWASLTPHRKLQSFCSLQNIALPPFLYKSVTPQVLPCIRSSSKSLLFRVDFASFSLCKKVGDW